MEPDAPQIFKHLVVEGRVQGVGFRWFVRERARRRGLRGWVQNRTDGSVELQVSGHEGVIADFVREVSRGPKDAHVTGVRELGAAGASAAADTGANSSSVAGDFSNPLQIEDLPYPFQIQRPHSP